MAASTSNAVAVLEHLLFVVVVMIVIVLVVVGLFCLSRFFRCWESFWLPLPLLLAPLLESLVLSCCGAAAGVVVATGHGSSTSRRCGDDDRALETGEKGPARLSACMLSVRLRVAAWQTSEA